jgi:membrane protein DedA with SNARE-associated domain
MSDLLLHGSIVIVVAYLLIGGLGVPVPEDVALLAAGVLIRKGEVDPVLAAVLVLLGVLGGDAMLFFLARRLGPAAYERKLFQRILPPDRRTKIEDAYRRYGGRMVFLARHVAGLRAAAFAMAGIAGMRPARFLVWDAAAAMISVPLVMGLGYLGASHVERMRAGMARAEHHVLLVLAFVALGYLAWRHVRKLRGRVPTSG